MNTMQNYVGKGNNAILPTSRVSRVRKVAKSLAKSNPRRPRQISEEVARKYLHFLWSEGDLTNDQFEYSKIIPVTDNGMAPQLRVGGLFVINRLDSIDYKPAIGNVVAISLKEEPTKYMVGRMKQITKNQVKLSYSNQEYPEVTINRKDILEFYQGLYALDTPVQ